jgi:hypothetical protein
VLHACSNARPGLVNAGGLSVSDVKTPEKVGVIVIHGVGDAEIGWINDYIVGELEHREPDLKFERHSEVYRLNDTGKSRPKRTVEPTGEEGHFRSVLREARLGDRARVAFAELHWADISNVGNGPWSRFLNILKLFFEAPHTLGASILQQSTGGIHSVIRWLVLAALWVLRWPIAGLQVAVFACAFGYLGVLAALKAMGHTGPVAPEYIPPLVIVLLAMTAIAALAIARWRAKYDIGLTSLALSTTVFATLSLVLVVLFVYIIPLEWIKAVVGPPRPSSSVWGLLSIGDILAMASRDVSRMEPSHAGLIAPYLAIGGWMIIAAWALWNVWIVSAILLIGLVAASRLIVTGRRQVPLMRPMAAIAFAIVQGIIWKLIICPLSVIVINLLVPASTPDMWAVSGFLLGVYDIRTRMFIIALMNSVVTLTIGAMIWNVSRTRSKLAAARTEQLGTGELSIPRLIVHPSILIALLLFNLATVTFYYVALSTEGVLFQAIDGSFKEIGAYNWVDYALGFTQIFTIAPYLLGVLPDASRGILHIGRDLVDHQYTPRLSFLRWLLPKGSRRDGVYPRRARVQNRLHTLMTEVVAAKGFDRLVFLTHSQGSVIMHDYLRGNRSDEVLKTVSRVDVVTLASPLTHLYQHYFRNYETTTASAETLCPQLQSWTNLWRIDDPIGNRVDIVKDDFIANVALGPGGHVNYWKEDAVCAAILNVIDPARLKMATAPAPAGQAQAS